MRLCSIPSVTDDMVLGRSIYDQNGVLLIAAGYNLSPELRLRLTEKGFSHVYVMEEGTEDIIPEDVISDEIRLSARAVLTDKVEKIQKLTSFKDISHTSAMKLIDEGYTNKLDIIGGLKSIVEEILNDISSIGTKFMNTLMFKSKDTYFVDHAINTTVLAILLGQRYHFKRKELMSLALGTFLHDIGKIVIEQLDDYDKPKTAEWLYREHPTYGYMLIRNDPNLTPVENQIVNQHHEYQDGSGFPIGLKGDNLPPVNAKLRETRGYIFRLAEICCVANAYDKLLVNPLEEKQLSPQDAIKQMILGAGTKYNKDIIQNLFHVVPIFPVGVFVQVDEIDDKSLVGCRGIVAKINEKAINKPVIILTKNKYSQKIKPRVIDTSKVKNIKFRVML